MKTSFATSAVSTEHAPAHEADWLDTARKAWRVVATSAVKAWSALPLPDAIANRGSKSSVDVDAISKRLDVEARAVEDGQDERPFTEDDALTGTQAEIVYYFRRMRAEAQERLARLDRKWIRTANAIDLDDARSRLADIPSRCRNEVLRITSGFQPRLDRLSERESQQHQHYLAFREEHQLSRIAKQPYSSWLTIALVAMLVASTTLLLSGLLPGTAAGAGSLPATWALGIGAAAIVVPFAIGGGIMRYINHNDAVLSIFSGLVTLLAVIAIAGFVYIATYYLEYTAANPDSTIAAALAAVLDDPWSPVADFRAWQWTGLAGVASLLALLVGYRADDPYPGYGEAQRAYYRASAERDRLHSKLRDSINAMIDAADREAVDIYKRLKSAVRRLGNAVDKADRLHSQLPELDRAIEEGCNIVLDRYRRANLSARTTPAPMCFSEHVCFRSSDELERPVANDERHRLETVVESMPEFEKHAIQVRQSLRDLNSQSIYALEEGGDDEDIRDGLVPV